MPFHPKNDDHSIEIVGFAFLLRDQITGNVFQNIVDHHHLWREELPALQSGQTAVVNVDPTRGVVDTNTFTPSARFSHLRPDGSPTWSLNVEADQIAVSCHLYTRWDKIWSQAHTIISQVIDVICKSEQEIGLQEIVFEVVDTFVNRGEAYDLSQLLNMGAHELSPTLFEVGALWHQHSGWYDDWDDDFRRLNQINFDARKTTQIGAMPNAEIDLVSIRHVQRLRPTETMKIADLKAEDRISLSEQMNRLHDENKSFLNRILVEDIQKRISLNQEGSK